LSAGAQAVNAFNLPYRLTKLSAVCHGGDDLSAACHAGPDVQG
jgi:hypothetical protein